MIQEIEGRTTKLLQNPHKGTDYTSENLWYTTLLVYASTKSPFSYDFTYQSQL